MEEKQKKTEDVIRSIADEAKKLSYIGSAGPYVILGDQAKTVVGASTIVAIAVIWFIIWQFIAHFLLSLAIKVENEDA